MSSHLLTVTRQSLTHSPIIEATHCALAAEGVRHRPARARRLFQRCESRRDSRGRSNRLSRAACSRRLKRESQPARRGRARERRLASLALTLHAVAAEVCASSTRSTCRYAFQRRSPPLPPFPHTTVVDGASTPLRSCLAYRFGSRSCFTVAGMPPASSRCR